MDREIIFKAKRKDNGEWVEGYYLNIAKINHFICTGKIKLDGALKGIIAPEMYEIVPDTLCQFTGLIDKNGKKIWENDIVKTSKFGKDDGNGHNHAGFDMFSVKWDNGGFALLNQWRRFNLRQNKEEYKVVGNIFDNPELLN